MMRSRRTSAFRCLALLAGLAVLVSAGPVRAEDPKPQITAQLSFDRPLDASMAPFVVAASRGLFGAENLAISFHFSAGSAEAIARVASGDSEFALVDINELIRFRDKADAPPIKAVFIYFNQTPYAIVARKSRGINALSDLAGKTLGVAEDDPSFQLWPALAKQNGIKTSSVKVYRMSAAVREPILSAGQVDAVDGFSYLSAVNLRDRGVPAGDLAVLRYADYGCEAYGFAIIVNPAFAAGKPEAVKGLVRAVIAGTHLSINEPERATAEVVARMDDADKELELDRLRTVIADNILTSEVRRNGLGSIDPARFGRAIEQIGYDFKFHRRPRPSDIFDDGFLPPADLRLVN